jgi:pilus assembly protein Flp/PilA
LEKSPYDDTEYINHFRTEGFLMLCSLIKDDAGQGLVEYALIIALVSIVALAALQVLGKKASNTLSNAASKLS